MDWVGLAEDRDSPGCGDEPSGFIKCGEFLDYLRTD
jgi:hypothetical protein